MISPVPDVKKLTIDPDTDSFIFLACDGIWNSLNSQEVVDFINDRLQAQSQHDSNKLTKIIEEVIKVKIYISPQSSFLFLIFSDFFSFLIIAWHLIQWEMAQVVTTWPQS